MTDMTSSSPLAGGLHAFRATIRNFFDGIGRGFSASLEASSRMAELERLNAMSDAELAEIGIRREDIARVVFRDVLYV